jgi:hypothetical protein
MCNHAPLPEDGTTHGVKSPEWPFIALPMTSTTAVVPFIEPRKDGIMLGLLMIIPRGFITASLREELDKELDKHYKEGGTFLWRVYEEAEQFRLGKLRTVGLINMVSLILIHKYPSIFTLA